MKQIFAGLESSGKSLALAIKVDELVHRNARYFKKTGIPRPIVSNLHFSKDFEQKAREMNVPIRYWQNLDEIVGHEEMDLIIDEIGTYFDSRLWTELSLDTRRWLAQTAKRGVEIYGTTQDFAQVDKSFRRLVNDLKQIHKVIGSRRPSKTKPVSKMVWGVCAVQTLNPRAYEEDRKEVMDFLHIPSFFFITLDKVSIYDTLELMKKSEAPPLEHIERHCKVCGKIHIKHI